VCWTLGLCRVMGVVVLPFVWWLMSDRGVKPAGVVPGFDHQRIDRQAGAGAENRPQHRYLVAFAWVSALTRRRSRMCPEPCRRDGSGLAVA